MSSDRMKKARLVCMFGSIILLTCTVILILVLPTFLSEEYIFGSDTYECISSIDGRFAWAANRNGDYVVSTDGGGSWSEIGPEKQRQLSCRSSLSLGNLQSGRDFSQFLWNIEPRTFVLSAVDGGMCWVGDILVDSQFNPVNNDRLSAGDMDKGSFISVSGISSEIAWVSIYSDEAVDVYLTNNAGCLTSTRIPFALTH